MSILNGMSRIKGITMKLSTKTRYGMRALIELAYHDGKPMLLKEISKNQKISMKYLDHIFSQLKTKGLIKKLKAKKGGYLLSKNPEDITVYEVIDSLEGVDIIDCIDKDIQCPLIETCGTRIIWQRVRDNIKKATNEITLKDIIDERKKLENKSKASYTFYI
jgi:Rrf2 family protein